VRFSNSSGSAKRAVDLLFALIAAAPVELLQQLAHPPHTARLDAIGPATRKLSGPLQLVGADKFSHSPTIAIHSCIKLDFVLFS